MLRNVQKVIKMAKKSKQVLERIENFESIKKDYEAQGYTYQKVEINIITANVVACVIMVIMAAIGFYVFHLLHKKIVLFFPLWLLLCMLLSTIIHELIHGIAWSLFCEKKWKSVQFGIIWKMLTPYCSCLEPLSWFPYLIGALAPCMILGIFPYIIAFISGNSLVLWFAVFNIAAASGDLMVVYHICKDRPSLMMDLPEECGYISIYQA